MQTLPLNASAPNACSRHDELDTALQALEGCLDAEDNHQSRCQAHATVAACLMEGTQASEAEWHWQQALRLARIDGQVDLILELLCALGRAAFETASAAERLGDHGQARVALNRARDYCFEGVQELHALQAPALEAAALERIASILSDCGDSEDAQALLDRAHRVVLGPDEAAHRLDGCPRVSAFGALA